MVFGLTLSAKTPQDLALKYLATLQALAYGTRLILDRLAEGGHQVFLLDTGIFALKDNVPNCPSHLFKGKITIKQKCT